MAYTATEWVSGETPLSAENMNHIEQGIAALDSRIVIEQTTITYTNGWTAVNKDGYRLIAAHAIREDALYFININKRGSAGGYILAAQNAANTSQVVELIWLKE